MGRPKRPMTKTTLLMIAAMWKPHLQPIVLDSTPPSVRPTEKPIGCPPPMEAKAMFLLLPSGNVLVIMLTADGKQKEIATPASARKTMSCVDVFARPHARVNADCSTQPVRYMGLLPTTSATDPSNSSVQPHARAYMEMGL